MSKKATSIDMTAMCDVAFLLLTFFILTATAKTPEALPVTTPSSTVKNKLPDTGLVLITVGSSEGKDKVFFGMKDRDVRQKTLELMGEKYGVKFSDKELFENFKSVYEIVSKEKLKSFLDKYKYTVASNGVMYSSDKVGLIPAILSDWFDKRVEYKDEMKRWGKEGDTEKYEFYKKRQLYQKILLLKLQVLPILLHAS